MFIIFEYISDVVKDHEIVLKSICIERVEKSHGTSSNTRGHDLNKHEWGTFVIQLVSITPLRFKAENRDHFIERGANSVVILLFQRVEVLDDLKSLKDAGKCDSRYKSSI